MIAYRNGFVKRFLKKVFSFFLKKGVDILIEVWYHLISGRDKATPKGAPKGERWPTKNNSLRDRTGKTAVPPFLKISQKGLTESAGHVIIQVQSRTLQRGERGWTGSRGVRPQVSYG
jgi:hypothetical protein